MKQGMRQIYNGFTRGTGGLKCYCCGARYRAMKAIRAKNKIKNKQITREANSNGLHTR